MSNEPTIEQKNEVIALFMGLEPRLVQPPDPALHCIEVWYNNESQSMKYHTSWDWLMPVVEKIHTLKKHNPDGKDFCLMSKLTIDMEMDGYYRICRCSILGNITHCYTLSIPHTYETVELPSIFVHDKATLIEAVYIAVYQFIQWYQQQKQNNGEQIFS